MDDKKNIFVLFAPGNGGNHVANLLSTDPLFPARATLDDYKNNQGKNAHVDQIQNLKLEHISKIQTVDRNVFCGHWAEYYWLYINDQINRFPNRKILIINMPNEGTLAYQRYQERASHSPYFFNEQRSLYTPLIIEKVFDEHDWFEIESKLIFSDSIDGFLDFTKKEMALDLDRDLCRTMHEIWFRKISQ
jgi:hypothetical protein